MRLYPSNMPWTPEQIKLAIGIVKESKTMSEACLEIAKRVGRVTTPNNLRKLFIQKGFASPGSMLKTDPMDIVERAEQVSSEERLRKENTHLVERLRDAEARQSVLDRLNKSMDVRSIRKRPKTANSEKREGTAVILASDWHVEEHVPRRADTAGNYYDLEVADKRVTRFFGGVKWLIEHNRPVFGIRDAVLWLGGDLINGYLREENLEENELAPVQAIKWIQARLVTGIDFLLAEAGLEQLVVVCSHGNHGRTTEKRRISTGAQNSFEWLLYQWLASHYEKDKRIKFVTDESNHQYIQVYDFNLHFTHGDEVKYQGGIGGMAVPLLKAVAGWDMVKRCDYHHIGHWHQLRDFGNVTVNGSLIGFNAYAMSVRAAPEPPQQAFYILDSKRGKTAQFPVWVSEGA